MCVVLLAHIICVIARSYNMWHRRKTHHACAASCFKYDRTHWCVWYYSFVWVTRIILTHICDVSHSYVRCHPRICLTRTSHIICVFAHSYDMWHGRKTHHACAASWLMYDRTYWYVWYHSPIYLTCVNYLRTHSYVWWNIWICVILLTHSNI